MKPKIKVCYAGSGVNFTHSLSVAFIVFGVLFLLGSLILFATADGYEVYVSLAVTLLIMFIISLAISAVLEALSSIAKTALYKRAIMESEYGFEMIYPYQMEQEKERQNNSETLDSIVSSRQTDSTDNEK